MIKDDEFGTSLNPEELTGRGVEVHRAGFNHELLADCGRGGVDRNGEVGVLNDHARDIELDSGGNRSSDSSLGDDEGTGPIHHGNTCGVGAEVDVYVGRGDLKGGSIVDISKDSIGSSGGGLAKAEVAHNALAEDVESGIDGLEISHFCAIGKVDPHSVSGAACDGQGFIDGLSSGVDPNGGFGGNGDSVHSNQLDGAGGVERKGRRRIWSSVTELDQTNPGIREEGSTCQRIKLFIADAKRSLT